MRYWITTSFVPRVPYVFAAPDAALALARARRYFRSLTAQERAALAVAEIARAEYNVRILAARMRSL